MKLIVSPFKDCYHNLASEEFIAENVAGDIFYLYVNNPAIIIGNNQNSYAEINHHFVEAQGIELVRRRSGGGAVYHDTGNLNFCFIMDRADKTTDQLFRDFTAPVIAALAKLGADATFSGRNDITIDGKKISGNAQWHSKDRSVVHGTLLFDSDLTVLADALKVNEAKFIGKAVKSVRSRVTNIKPYLDEDYDMALFIQKIVSSVQEHFDTFIEYHYSDSERALIEQLVATKYGTKQWNYGKSPNFEYSQRFKYAKGHVEVNFNVENGIISAAKIYGDFFGLNPALNEVEQALIGAEFQPDDLLARLHKINLSSYIDGLTADVLVDGLFK